MHDNFTSLDSRARGLMPILLLMKLMESDLPLESDFSKMYHDPSDQISEKDSWKEIFDMLVRIIEEVAKTGYVDPHLLEVTEQVGYVAIAKEKEQTGYLNLKLAPNGAPNGAERIFELRVYRKFSKN